MIFQKFQNFQKLHFDQKLRLRRYLAQPHVHVLKEPYAVVLSYDFIVNFFFCRLGGWGEIERRLSHSKALDAPCAEKASKIAKTKNYFFDDFSKISKSSKIAF